MVDLTDLSQYLNQAGIDPSQGGGNATTLPQMPGQGIQQPQQQATPTTSPDDFDSQIAPLLKKIEGGTTAIEKAKREEYLKNLGLTPSNENTFKGKFLKGLREFGLAGDAQRLGTPYKGANERIQDSAQAEYEKMYPVVKTEIQELRKAKTAKEANDRMIEIQRQKNEAEAAKVKEQEATKRTLNDFRGKRIGAQILGDEAKAEYEKSMTEHMKQVTKNIEETNPNDSPITKTMKAIQKTSEDTGEPVEQVIERYKSLSQKTDNSTFSKILNDKTGEAMKTYKEMHPTRPNIFMMPGQVNNKDTGNIEDTFVPIDKNNIKIGEPIAADGFKPGKNADRTKIDRAYTSTNDNVSTALGTVLNAIRDSALGKKEGINNWTGPVQGNPLSSSLRAMGVDTNGAASNGRNAGEALLDTFRGTTAYQHVKAQLGSTRVPLQIIQENEKNIGNKVGTGDNLARGLGSIRYSAQIGKNGNMEYTQPNEIGPEHSKRMQEEIEKAINIAKNPNAGPVVLPKDFTSIQNEIRNRKKITAPKTALDKFKAAHGIQ